VSNYGHSVKEICHYEIRESWGCPNISCWEDYLDVNDYLMGTFIICILLSKSSGGRRFGKVTLLWKYRMDIWWYTFSRESSRKCLLWRPRWQEKFKVDIREIVICSSCRLPQWTPQTFLSKELTLSIIILLENLSSVLCDQNIWILSDTYFSIKSLYFLFYTYTAFMIIRIASSTHSFIQYSVWRQVQSLL
jgi:hypothetical protein